MVHISSVCVFSGGVRAGSYKFYVCFTGGVRGGSYKLYVCFQAVYAVVHISSICVFTGGVRGGSYKLYLCFQAVYAVVHISSMCVFSGGVCGGSYKLYVCVLQAVYAVVQEVEELVVLGQAGSEGPFMVVASAFVDSSSLSFKNISVRLAKVGGRGLHVLLCTYVLSKEFDQPSVKTGCLPRS